MLVDAAGVAADAAPSAAASFIVANTYGMYGMHTVAVCSTGPTMAEHSKTS